MNKQLRIGIGVFVCCAFFSGCGDGIPKTDSVSIVGVDGNRISYRYSVPSSSFDTPPSSLWVLDTATEKSRRFLEATLQFSPEIAGDFYVTELVREERTLGRVVVGEIGTSRRRVIHERSLEPHSSTPSNHLAAGDLAVVLADRHLLVAELSDPDSQRTIDLPACARKLIALDEARVFLMCEPESSRGEEVSTLVMIDLVTEEVTEFLPAPGASQPLYLRAQVADSHLVVSRIEGETEGTRVNQILALDLTTGEWRVVADLGSHEVGSAQGKTFSVNGFEGVNILVEGFDFQPFESEWSLQIIDLESGASRPIVRRGGVTGLIPEGGLLSDGRVIWYEPALEAIAVRDLFLDQTRVFPVRLPN